jgi:hypothetical protein
MSIRPVHVVSSLALPLAFAALSLAAPDARADAPPKRAATAPAREPDLLPWSRRFPPPQTKPAAYSRPRVAAQVKAPARPAPAAVATSAPSPTMVAIEIREIRAGAPAQIERFSLPLGELGSSRIETQIGNAEWRISVHREGSGASAPLRFDVRKSVHVPKSPSTEARVNAGVRMSAGKPVVIAAVDRADGSRTEVLAQLN